jgi:thiol-disulfide isomerase/thioredoxin
MTRSVGRWLLFACASGVALAVGLYFGWRAEREIPDASTLLALSLPDTSGHPQPMNQWKGKVLVVNFWATWCAPCREEMPEFVKAQGELGSKGLQFVGIAVDEPDQAERFATEIGLNYPVLIGGYGAIELSRALGNRVVALPFTIVVDRQGRVAHTQLGPLKPTQLRAIVSKLL